MPYIVDQTKLLTETFRRMARLPAHRLAGHVANLDYWRTELHRVVESLDSYSTRFRRMKEATNRHLKVAPVPEADLPPHLDHIHALKPDVRTTPTVRDSELRELRKSLMDAASQFARASVRTGILKEEEAETFLERS